MRIRRSDRSCLHGHLLRRASHRGRRQGVELMWEQSHQLRLLKGGPRAKVRASSVPFAQRHAKPSMLLPVAAESELQAEGTLLAASLVQGKRAEVQLRR